MFIEMKNVDFIYGYKTPFEKKALENIKPINNKGRVYWNYWQNWFGQIYFGSADERAFGAADR